MQLNGLLLAVSRGTTGSRRDSERFGGYSERSGERGRLRWRCRVTKDNPMHKPDSQPVSPIAFRLMRSLTIIDSSVVGFRPRISAAPAFPRIRHPVISSTLTR